MNVLSSADEHTKQKFADAVDPAQLPIDENLQRRIHYVAAWYDTSIDWIYPPNPTPWQPGELKRFEPSVDLLLAGLRKALEGEFEIKDER